MKITKYLSQAVSRPKVTYHVLRMILSRVLNILRNRGAGRAFGYLAYYFSHFTGIAIDKPYWELVKSISHGNYVKTKVLDYEMIVDLNDQGISRQLWLEGIREYGAVEAYKHELLRLQEIVGASVTVLDIAANIGYYILLAGNTLQNPMIFAIEPAPANVKLLHENVHLNNLDQKVDVTRGVLSNNSGTGRLFLSTQSNVHSMEPVSHDYIEVPMWRANDFLKLKEISPNEINVVRMDTEGHESEILEGMEEILSAKGPLLLFIEFDARMLKNGRLGKTIDLLKRNGFKITYACNDYFTGTVEEFFDIDYLNDNLKRHNAAEVFLRRGY